MTTLAPAKEMALIIAKEHAMKALVDLVEQEQRNPSRHPFYITALLNLREIVERTGRKALTRQTVRPEREHFL